MDERDREEIGETLHRMGEMMDRQVQWLASCVVSLADQQTESGLEHIGLLECLLEKGVVTESEYRTAVEKVRTAALVSEVTTEALAKPAAQLEACRAELARLMEAWPRSKET